MNMLHIFKPNSNRRHCCHNNEDGTQCKAHPQTGSDYCFFHDPKLHKKRKAARRAGGKANRRTTRKPVDLPDNPLQTLSQIADLLRETLDRARRSEIKAHDATAIGYVANTLVGVMEKEERQEEKARRSVAVDAFLKTVFPNRTAAATEQGIEEQVMAEQGMKEQTVKPDPKDELAALLFADDNSFSENAKREIIGNSEPEATGPQPVSQTANQTKASQDENAWNGASLEFLAISRAVLEKEGQSESVDKSANQNESESVNKSKSADKSAVSSIDKSEIAGKSFAASPSSPVTPAKQETARNQANPDEQFSGIPGLQQKHVNYMKFFGEPEIAGRKRKPVYRTVSAALRAEEMRELAARLRGR